MESNHAVEAFTALGHPGRLAVFRLLARRAPGGVRPGELGDALELKPSTLSVYLATLERAGLIASRRDGKSILYRIALDEVGDLLAYLAADCCRGRPELCLPFVPGALRPVQGGGGLTDGPLNVLFLCTGNSARSIMAEAILSEIGGGTFRAFSAGTRAHSEVNPHVLALLRSLGRDTARLRAKTVAELQAEGAPAFDFVFTLCDRAANEECPPWPGSPMTAHWGLPDPVKASGSEAEKDLAFREVYEVLEHRLSAFLALPIATLDRISLQHRLDALGQPAKVEA